jgi:hypothetical protein
MAYQPFYIQSGGSNANAGTTTGSPVWSNTSAVVWVGTTTSTLTVTDSAASAVQVGDFINVGGTYVSKVTSINAIGAPTYVFTLSASSASWGTEPSGQTYSSSGTVVDGGAWADLTQGILTGATTVPQSTKVNIKAATYSYSGNTVVSLLGTTTKPLVYAGYNTTPGDLDNGSAVLSYPVCSMGAHYLDFAGSFATISALSVTGSSSTTATLYGATSPANGFIRFRHCRAVNTSTASGAAAFGAELWTTATQCYFAMTTASSTGVVVIPGGTLGYELIGCYIDGSLSSGVTITTSTCVVRDCTILTGTSYGLEIQGTSGAILIDRNTFIGKTGGGDFIHITALVSNGDLESITNNYFYNCGGYDINNATGTNTCIIEIANNVHNNPASGQLNGFGDFTELNPLTESINPFVSSTDLHLIASSNGASAGLPGQWENLTAGLQSTPDVGAWQRNASSGGSIIVNPGMDGGWQ